MSATPGGAHGPLKHAGPKARCPVRNAYLKTSIQMSGQISAQALHAVHFPPE